MFADSAKIFIRSGKGGDGHVSFRRELYVAAGGPDGGDGGKGGDLIFEVDEGINTLNEFRHVRKYFAKDGEQGGKRKCHGSDGDDLVVKVPPGTVLKDYKTGQVITDMSHENKREVILKGGRGGKGNQHYATATMQVPKYAQPGKPGKELEIILELKVIADVGLVGFPNVGKSTFLSRVTNAKPKIANYHFTTLNPNLGVVDLDGGDGFVIADIPGLIEGASEGIGLGHEFLKHIERTKVIIHMVDAASTEGRDPLLDIKAINDELIQYNPELSKKPQVIGANKCDIFYGTEEDTVISLLKEEFEPLGIKVFPISAVSGKGIGKASLTPEIVKAVDEALEARELIKINVLKNCSDDPREMADIVSERTHSAVVQDLSKKRYLHTLGVQHTAACLAMRYHADYHNANLAGLLHDCAKCNSDKTILKKCIKYNINVSDTEKRNPSLLHGKLGAYYGKTRFGIEDEDILNAVIYHTTGRPNMSLLEKIIFIADYIEPERKGIPGLKKIRIAAFEDLDKALFLALENTLNYLQNNTSNKNEIDETTTKTYYYYKTKIAWDALEDKKGEEIQMIEIGDISIIADYFIIANGNNSSQVQALADNVEEALSKKGYEPKAIEGIRNSSWILMDYNDVIVHVFSKEDRLFYDLERIWRDGKIISKEDL
ncbi:developmentally regulated gtp-binding protein-related [Holotrichia oblita]|nr:developmentally regulated gtp-binding protein-related [Holotrichia oblita]